MSVLNENSGEKRVYRIQIGNIPSGDVQEYINTIAERFKRIPIVDPSTGEIDLSNVKGDLSQDIFLPSPDYTAEEIETFYVENKKETKLSFFQKIKKLFK